MASRSHLVRANDPSFHEFLLEVSGRVPKIRAQTDRAKPKSARPPKMSRQKVAEAVAKSSRTFGRCVSCDEFCVSSHFAVLIASVLATPSLIAGRCLLPAACFSCPHQKDRNL